MAGAAAWWQGVSVPGGMLTCSGGCFVRSARGRTREKVWGAQSAKDVQVMRSFYKTYQKYAIKASSLPSMLEDGTFKL